MKDQVIQILKNGGFKVVDREAVVPNTVAVDLVELVYEPLTFPRIRKVHTFQIYGRAFTADQAQELAESIMTLFWTTTDLNSLETISASFDGEEFVVGLKLIEEPISL